MFDHSICALLLLAGAAVIFLPALIIGSVGAHRLIITRQQEGVYTNTTCFVSNITAEALTYDCNCDGCHPSTCYAEHFAVQYYIENGTEISSAIHIDEIPYRLQVKANNNYTCFYDRTNVRSVQWSQPNERPALAMLISGFSVAGVVVIAVILGQIWWFIEHYFSLKNSHTHF